ncbi:hypothetical protein C8034_v007683 [Colletotrichum sidae]|uniref:Ecp2 effector protein-like domain-containing protein n=1 Tax=Colletotrichum sidae TaxID=1347389 RepID=A0A4V3I1S4_9PEZI|nr:hypothetical protein C8034_v007683 [Colletotrichum sidae]
MRLITVLAFAAQAVALAVPGDAPLIGAPAAIARSVSQEVKFMASNGSEVIVNIGTGFGIANNVHTVPGTISKAITFEPANGFAELCTTRATRKEGNGLPRRDDCQALQDYVKNNNVLVYFEDNDSDLNRWAEIFWVGSCAFRAHTPSHNIVFSNADITHFIERVLSREAWTVEGRVSGSGEADCAAVDGPSGFASMFWRLEQRGPLPNINTLMARDPETSTLVVQPFDVIPANTSAYIDGEYIDSHTLTKRFHVVSGDSKQTVQGPLCKPTWMSGEWSEPKMPLERDCRDLLKFVDSNKAEIHFDESDKDKLARFASYETCGLAFIPRKFPIVITSRDMADFLSALLDWSSTNRDGKLRGKMGVECSVSTDKLNGVFQLFWRDPQLPLPALDPKQDPEHGAKPEPERKPEVKPKPTQLN